MTEITADEMHRRRATNRCPKCNADMFGATKQDFSSELKFYVYVSSGLCNQCQDLLLIIKEEEKENDGQ